MQNDSIETLVLRHLGSAAPAPTGLEATLVASVRQEAREIERQARAVTDWRERRISRRRVLRLVALLGQDSSNAASASRPAYS